MYAPACRWKVYITFHYTHTHTQTPVRDLFLMHMCGRVFLVDTNKTGNIIKFNGSQTKRRGYGSGYFPAIKGSVGPSPVWEECTWRLKSSKPVKPNFHIQSLSALSLHHFLSFCLNFRFWSEAVTWVLKKQLTDYWFNVLNGITTHSVVVSPAQKQNIFKYSMWADTVVDMPFASPGTWLTISHQDKSRHALSSCLLPELRAIKYSWWLKGHLTLHNVGQPTEMCHQCTICNYQLKMYTACIAVGLYMSAFNGIFIMWKCYYC